MDPSTLKPGHICDVCGGPLSARHYTTQPAAENHGLAGGTTPPPTSSEHVVYVCPTCDHLGAR